MAKAKKLKIIPLGGLDEIGKNLTALEYGNEIIMVDCGMAFPDDDMPGVDMVINDITYLEKNWSKIKGIFLTHGHEDHIGGLPYFLKAINVPVYGTRLTIGLVEHKLKEHNLLSSVKLVRAKYGNVINAGQNFSVEFVRTNHSIAVATAANIGKTISIYMDDELISKPKVQSAITDGEAIISGSADVEEAKTLASLINAGALPVSIEVASISNVGAQLGEEALPNAIKAGAIGIGAIFIFMIAYYRIPGIIASMALTLYTTLVLFIFSENGVALTLPGIAAFLLTVGMAVDANVLIFERIREELKKGLSVKTAVDKGFHNALSSIVDSNITTIIAGLVLYYMGTGTVKGFAVTLMIGIVVSMFTALVVTKTLMKLGVNMGLLKTPAHFRVKRG